MQPTILLVDDEEEILDFIERILNDRYRIVRASNGLEAIKKLSADCIQLVVSDVMMPEMDGFELCQRIKSDFELSHIPIILLTAKNILQSKIEGLKCGADVYIEKPFSPEHLYAQVASLLENRNRLKEYFAKSPLVHIKGVAHNRMDEAFMEQLYEAIQKNITDHELDVERLATMMNMSRPTLYRKIKAITTRTPNELINEARLKRAAEQLEMGGYKVFEIAGMVGFQSQSSFGKAFLKHYKVTPAAWQRIKKKQKVQDNSKVLVNAFKTTKPSPLAVAV